jgi:hypothetical protein
MTKAVTTSGGNVQTAVVYSYDSMGRPTGYWQCAPHNCGSASIWSMTRVAHVPAVLAGMYATQGRYNLRVLKYYYGLNHLHHLTMTYLCACLFDSERLAG